jgi:hypothetical protein
MSVAEWFWLVLTIACITWYSTITVYVAYRGWFDIKNMLRRLAAGKEPGDVE